MLLFSEWNRGSQICIDPLQLAESWNMCHSGILWEKEPPIFQEQ